MFTYLHGSFQTGSWGFKCLGLCCVRTDTVKKSMRFSSECGAKFWKGFKSLKNIRNNSSCCTQSSITNKLHTQPHRGALSFISTVDCTYTMYTVTCIYNEK